MIQKIHEHFLSLGDPRVKGWLFMDSFVPTAILSLLYLVLIYGIKKFMKNRKPYEMKNFLLFYNFCQVIGTFYMFTEFLTVAISKKYSLTCQEVDYSSDPLGIRMLRATWLFYLSKLVDFIDTIVFALRKKDNQITLLHVFHHFTIFPIAWVCAKYFGGGQSFFGCMLNSLVHTIMYGYYGLAALGPSVQKYLWWKKYITQIQLIQFLSIIVHSFVNMLQLDCKYSKSFSTFYSFYTLVIAGLFVDFYFKAYKKKTK
uniref:Elongation of very long chain fatty acids protein n=1 Tax=Brachionus koreanus TaxID=1199090 RepID=A0A291LM92_9BILA|nr:elongase 7 [Brachionus koreanus]QBO55915.1 elongation of very long chain fatty acid 9e [Brachionus koreanus]